MSNILVIIWAWLWIIFAPSSFFLEMIYFLLYVDSMGSLDDGISSVISEIIRRAASLNCTSIVLLLLQVEIPAMKRKHLTFKIVNPTINDIQWDNLNLLQIMRVITDTKVLKMNFWGTSNLSEKQVQQMFNFNVLNIWVLILVVTTIIHDSVYRIYSWQVW